MALSNFYVLISILPVYHTNIIYQATAVMQPYFEGFWGLRLKVQSWIIFFIFFFYLLTLTFLFFFSIIILLHKNLIQPQQCYRKWEKMSCISIIYAQNIYYLILLNYLEDWCPHVHFNVLSKVPLTSSNFPNLILDFK